MRRFILKTLIFVLPVFIAYILSKIYYSTAKGDLLRIGYIMDNSNYRDLFNKEFKRKIFFTNISDLDVRCQHKYDVLAIGDSFSEQGSFSYLNYLAEKDSMRILHFDRFLQRNPIQTLLSVLEGDLIDYIKVDYILIQLVERNLIKRLRKIDSTKKISSYSLNNLINESKKNKERNNNRDGFFSDRTIKFLLYNIFYFLDDNAFFSETYRVETKEVLFSNNKKELLFYFRDLDRVELNNNVESISKLNNTLNNLSERLKKKDIKLIVLLCPDKFDFYYKNIVKKNKYPEPLFFKYFEEIEKDYLYINSKSILTKEMEHKKDIYLYDDSHWSPYGAKIIANELTKVIFKKNTISQDEKINIDLHEIY